MQVSIVIPVHNEADNIAPLLQEIVEVLKGAEAYEIIVVEDGSNDQTASVLIKSLKEIKALRILQHEKSCGQSTAIYSGVKAAKYPVIATLDGDGQNDPADIPAMIDKLAEGYDLVHGWRKHRHDAWLSRRLPSKIANWWIARASRKRTSVLAGCTLTSTASGPISRNNANSG